MGLNGTEAGVPRVRIRQNSRGREWKVWKNNLGKTACVQDFLFEKENNKKRMCNCKTTSERKARLGERRKAKKGRKGIQRCEASIREKGR